MASASIPSPRDNGPEPGYVPAGVDQIAASDQSSPEAVRRIHLGEEAYVKAVGRVNYFYAILFGTGAAYYTGLTALHLSGKVSAGWIVRPGWVALQAALYLTAILTLVAGLGLRRLKPWAIRVEALFVLCLAVQYPLAILAYSKPMALADLVGGGSLLMAFLSPLINLWDVQRSIVFCPEYHRVVASTPGVAVTAKLPWDLKLSAILFFVLYLLIGALVGFTA